MEGTFGRLGLASEILITLGTPRVPQRQVMTLHILILVLLPVSGSQATPPQGHSFSQNARKGLKWLGTPIPAWAQGFCVIPASRPPLGQTCFPVSLFAGNILWKRRELQDLKQQYPKSCSEAEACPKQIKDVPGNFLPPSTIFQVQLLPAVLSYHKVWDSQSWNWGVKSMGGEKVVQKLWIHWTVGKCYKTTELEVKIFF